MNVIKILILLISIPFFSMGQNKYPKDTIYIKYMPEKRNKKISNWDYKENSGIYFSIKDKITGKHMSLFYPYGEHIDTVCLSELHHYKTLSLKEINRKEWKWYKKKFGGQPPFGNKNGVFVTYLIEVIPLSFIL